MKAMRMINALTDMDSALIEAAAPGKAKRPRWVRTLAAVACLALVIGSAGTVVDRLGLFRAGCSAWPGDFVDGRYYYRAHHGALYCWEDGPGEAPRKENDHAMDEIRYFCMSAPLKEWTMDN